MRGFIESERAVSGIIGFILVFGIMLTSVGIVYVYGFPLLLETKDANHLKNVEQAFIVLGYNINRVVLGNTPSQEVELRMSGGTVTATGNNTMNITWFNGTGGEYLLIPLTTIEYEFQGTTTMYEGGGVWVRYPWGDTVMLSEPLIINGSTIGISVGQYIGGSSSKSGTGFARVNIKGTGPVDVVSENNALNINITISSEYYRGWERYFNETLGLNTTSDDNNKTVSGVFDQAARLVISRKFIITEVL